MSTETYRDNGPERPTVILPTQQTDPGTPTLPFDASGAEVSIGGEPHPALTPPSEIVEAAMESSGIAAWHDSKKITSLWCNLSSRNAYAGIAGLGWKRISNANDSSFLTLVMLASHAEQTNANCRIRIEADNEIHEIYVW
jgi:hypothetical protein